MKAWKRRSALIAVSAVLAMALIGCGSPSSATIPRGAAGSVGYLETGTVLAVKPVVLEGETGYLGPGAGAVVGSAVGAAGGAGSGRRIAAAGGAAAGGIIGGVLEKELTKKQAQELTIDLDDGHTVIVVQELQEPGFMEGDRVDVVETHAGTARVAHSRYSSDGLY